ncbi:nitroreductase family protein [Clostridium botulinum]|uniref:Nitroreductase family protein n=1 Tax=Clostridium botulinum TaxID=1491 RepID=A0ABC8CQW2_CLOBO|nr:MULTISPECIES: nitroreductase family protein [Clostridium]AVQ38115.1 nitroreductase family protein [Clostridium botulinum]EDU38697.1 nitroreductase family protein [Clostridium sporogenes ATCC 15579]MBD5637817.1 nitroreductase family protein [Clostridium botulinum]MBO0576377.1 nitroreductase family protein [Clostridium botulinum]MBU5299299.1 nitroreductase family protein [Clostridium sporogenes]
MSELKKIIEERRSANNFIEGVKIPDKDFTEIFELLKLAPSCFNIQHSNYLVVTDEEKKEQLRKAAFNQYKVHTASAVILVLGDKLAYKNAENIYSGMLNLGIMSKLDYDNIVRDINNLYEGRGEDFQRSEAIRNTSLSAMMFMLIAKDKGWDTCPMIGFNQEEVRQIFNIPENYEIALMITMGKEDTSKTRMRGYRKPVGEFVSFNSFE